MDLGFSLQLLTLLTLRQVNESVLKKVIEWCEHHKGDPPAAADDDSDSRKKSTDIDEWDQKFMQVDQEMLFEIILVRITVLSGRFLLALIQCACSRLPTTWISNPFLMSDVKLLPI